MLHKKILLFALSFSLHSVIMGMQTEEADVQGTTEIELKQHAHNLTQNIYNLTLPEARNTHIPPLMYWLVQKRNEIVDPTEWSGLVKRLEDNITLFQGDPRCNANALFFVCIPQAIKNTIIKHVSELQSNQNATELIDKINKNIDECYCYNISEILAFC